MLNYFTETGEQYVADGGTCTSYKDRAGNPVTVNTCTGEGPRGAWDADDQARQAGQDRRPRSTASAPTSSSLEEIENSAKFAGVERRDDALATLVDALNDAAG